MKEFEHACLYCLLCTHGSLLCTHELARKIFFMEILRTDASQRRYLSKPWYVLSGNGKIILAILRRTNFSLNVKHSLLLHLPPAPAWDTYIQFYSGTDSFFSPAHVCIHHFRVNHIPPAISRIFKVIHSQNTLHWVNPLDIVKNTHLSHQSTLWGCYRKRYCFDAAAKMEWCGGQYSLIWPQCISIIMFYSWHGLHRVNIHLVQMWRFVLMKTSAPGKLLAKSNRQTVTTLYMGIRILFERSLDRSMMLGKLSCQTTMSYS